MHSKVRRNETPRPILPTLFAIAVLTALAALTACSASGRDAAITTRVRTVLQADLLVDASAIRVTTDRGVVTLDGSVPGENAHRMALDLAHRVDGVVQVRDRLSVTPGPPEPAQIAPPAPAESAPANLGGVTAENRRPERRRSEQPGGNYGLMAAVVGPHGDVSLETDRVEASAEPVSRRESPAAPDAAAAPALDEGPPRGDEVVGGSIPPSPALLGPADSDDAALTARVREALAELGGRIQVLTRGGVVILSGAVETELQKTEALRLVRATKGVARVEDRVIVLES
jgi:hyperosmotically inducible protein